MTEFCEVLDKNNKVCGVITRKEAEKKKVKLKAALTIVTNSKGQYFTSKRNPKKKIFPNKWIIGAGGAVQVGETFKEAAKRELKEELGINSTPTFLFDFEYLGTFGEYYAKVFLAKWDEKIFLEKKELIEGKWATKKEVLALAKTGKLAPDTKKYFKKYLKLKKSETKK